MSSRKNCRRYRSKRHLDAGLWWNNLPCPYLWRQNHTKKRFACARIISLTNWTRSELLQSQGIPIRQSTYLLPKRWVSPAAAPATSTGHGQYFRMRGLFVQFLAKHPESIPINDINSDNISRVFFRPVRFWAGRFILFPLAFALSDAGRSCKILAQHGGLRCPLDCQHRECTPQTEKPAGNMYVQ